MKVKVEYTVDVDTVAFDELYGITDHYEIRAMVRLDAETAYRDLAEVNRVLLENDYGLGECWGR